MRTMKEIKNKLEEMLAEYPNYSDSWANGCIYMLGWVLGYNALWKPKTEEDLVGYLDEDIEPSRVKGEGGLPIIEEEPIGIPDVSIDKVYIPSDDVKKVYNEFREEIKIKSNEVESVEYLDDGLGKVGKNCYHSKGWTMCCFPNEEVESSENHESIEYFSLGGAEFHSRLYKTPKELLEEDKISGLLSKAIHGVGTDECLAKKWEPISDTEEEKDDN